MTQQRSINYEESKLVDWLKEQQETLKTQPKTMFCIAFEVYTKRKVWQPRMEYVHAEDTQRARLTWAAGVPRGFKMGINVKLVGIAPVVGVFVENEKKEIYSV